MPRLQLRVPEDDKKSVREYLKTANTRHSFLRDFFVNQVIECLCYACSTGVSSGPLCAAGRGHRLGMWARLPFCQQLALAEQLSHSVLQTPSSTTCSFSSWEECFLSSGQSMAVTRRKATRSSTRCSLCLLVVILAERVSASQPRLGLAQPQRAAGAPRNRKGSSSWLLCMSACSARAAILRTAGSGQELQHHLSDVREQGSAGPRLRLHRRVSAFAEPSRMDRLSNFAAVVTGLDPK
jgi:hypothetical protein